MRIRKYALIGFDYSMLSRKEKEIILQEVAELLQKSRFLIFTDPTALDAAKTLNLRRELRKINAQFRLVKKTILKMALEKASVSGNLPEDIFKTSIAVLFLEEPNIEAAKILYKFSKENEKFALLGGWLEQKGLAKEQIIQFAKLPPREVLLGQLASTIQAPLRNLAVVLQANLRNLVFAIAQIKN